MQSQVLAKHHPWIQHHHCLIPLIKLLHCEAHPPRMSWPTRAQRTASAPPELAAPESAMSAPAGNGTTDEVVIEVGGDDSPLSSASPEVVRLPRWDDLGRSYTLNHNLVHKFIPTFSFKGTVTRPRSSSSLSSSRVMIPCLSSAALQDGSYQPGRAYHRGSPPHELRGGSRDDGAPSNWRLVTRPCLSSSPI